jgi:hypothetical protein
MATSFAVHMIMCDVLVVGCAGHRLSPSVRILTRKLMARRNSNPAATIVSESHYGSQQSVAACPRYVGLISAQEPALPGTPLAVWASAAVITSWSEANHREVIASRSGRVSVPQVPVRWVVALT